jgi:hypothetical protein
MIRPRLLVCAEGIVIDKRSNNVSAFEILEQLNPNSLPTVLPKLVVLSAFEKDEEDPDKIPVNIRITLGELEIINQEIPHNFQGKKRCRNVLTIGGVVISQPGILEISASIDNKTVMSYTIEVTIPEKAVIQPPSHNTTNKKTTSKNVAVKGI